MIEIKRALISVYDKTNLVELAKSLVSKGIEIISSGGTATYLEKAGIAVAQVESLTDFPEMLSGRVKTLHPKIHGGILFLRNNTEHQKTIQAHQIKSIDLVIINLYPFEETIAKPGITVEEAIEQIDIGGPSLLRSASKNHESVIVLSSPNQYADFIAKLHSGEISHEDRRKYAVDAFKRTCSYDKAISNYLESVSITAPVSSSEGQNLELKPLHELRYGENPHQKAHLYNIENTFDTKPDNVFCSIKKLSGKELSYNNWLDIDSAWALISEFESEFPACAIVKHNSPCGVAIGKTSLEAYTDALDCDPVSAFGGIVAINSEVDKTSAEKMSELFLEIIIATSFTSEALEVLTKKKNLRLLTAPLISTQTAFPQYRSILDGGILSQEFDNKLFLPEDLKVVTEEQPTEEDWLHLLFAFRVCKHVRSNAIVLVNGNKAVGICGGQTNRLSSVRIALEQASDLATNSVLASDGFFPFADNVELAAQGRIKAIIQPGGSIRDEEVIAAANKYKIPMVFTGMRHFKH